MIERRHVIYEGRVQGVGFRYRAHRLSGHIPVAGWVRNLPDGSVELVAEGDPGDVRRFLDGIAREMSRNIQNAVEDVLPPADPPLTGFEIRY